mgnify:FL=1
MSKKNNDIEFVDLDSLEYEDFEFGKYLRSVRKAKGISIRQLAKEVDKTPTYLSDIENGHNKPPEKELLDTIIQKLNLDEFPKVKATLFDLAARERNDIPADVKDYIMSNQILLKIIRTAKDRPDSEQIWSNIVKTI